MKQRNPGNSNSWTLFTTLLLLGSPVFAGNTLSIRSTIQVVAPLTQAFHLIRSLGRFPEWSPFLVSDPEQRHFVTGPDGELGSTFHWEGVREKSKGQQTLVYAEDSTYLKFACTMEKPFAGNPVFEYRLRQTDAGVEIQQDFNLHLTTFQNLIIKILGLRGKMIATNKLGLERLKALLENPTNLSEN